MAQSMNRGGRFMIGDYVIVKQIGTGSFSTVWHGCHRVDGTDVAIKEIATARLDPKLRESLKSEIIILQKINHPNIIRLHDMIEEPGKIYFVLEYCRGGDLSMYIQRRQGRIAEATAKHFMQQLASGLKILRENNLIHRDLKPQNLLLSAADDNSTLKIADFGFARSLQPWVLAETLCGSPLYMAPEIMQLQKYDAKADLWSVGAILFQLVTGKTPFTGNNQIQLLQNIVKSTKLQFPLDAKHLSPHCIDLCQKLLRRHPVERLTFEEFFNHPFLAQKQPDELSRNQQPQRVIDGFSLEKSKPGRSTEETFQEDGLPFILDDDSSSHRGGPSFAGIPQRSSCGFSQDARADRKEFSSAPSKTDPPLDCSNITHKSDTTGFSPGEHGHSEGNLKESSLMDHRLCSKGASRLSNMQFRSSFSLQASGNIETRVTEPVLTVGPATNRIGPVGRLESSSFAPGASQGSADIIDPLEQPTDGIARIGSLQQFASAITDLVNEKIAAERHLEAFSIELVMLAIWKQALDVCQMQVALAIQGSPNQETTKLREILRDSRVGLNIKEDTCNILRPENVYSHIERAFLNEIGKAEELAKHIEPGNTEVPDAMEMIFQSALDLGRKGAVEEYMGRTESAVVFYSKAVRLLAFLQVEAPLLLLNPPFSLTNSDRYRLGSYIDVLNNRQSVSRSQMMTLLKCEDQHCSP
ncbi:PREDICTED: serine/threonine-protein kinase ATG1c-like isoform X2 [Nicotiana attenuata]|uniref:serine/threonine-protein kinase ATG1c-like isoform X2 n=1 Tax=Nicotiana attenuata TaxID=49451 RepID=UPI0009048E90|nr:PREDICTED: serine/threonine-protein kinase ATG1c-like isoform X2 [Nicotiana attenuata]